MRRARLKALLCAVPLMAAPVAVYAGAGPASASSAPPAAAVAGNTRVTVDISFPVRNAAKLARLTTAQATRGSGVYHHWLTPTQFKQRFGITAAQYRRVSAQYRAQGLTVRPEGAQAVAVSGPASRINRVFSGRLVHVAAALGRERVASASPLRTSGAAAAMHGKVIGLEPVIKMRTSLQITPANRYGKGGLYWADDLKQAYQYPAFGTPAHGGATGAGTTIGILMSDAPSPADFTAYFAHEHLTAPSLTVVPVNGGAPFDPAFEGSGEVSLDTQQSAGMAPQASVVVYDIPDLSDENIFGGEVDAIETDAVDVLSSSFGGCELDYTAGYNGGTDYTYILRAYHQLALQANAEGITLVASSGDSGSLGCPPLKYFYGQSGSFVRGVEYPASDPNVTAVGGTNLVTTHQPPSLNSAYVRESEYGDPEAAYDPYGVGQTLSGGYWGSGGGFATLFAEPSWQYRDTGNRTGQRALPDVSLQMGGCPGGISLSCGPDDSADVLLLGGTYYGAIGTSASAPDFAGTVALYDQVHGGRAGNINPVLYDLGSAQRSGQLGYQVFHDHIYGYTGYYRTAFSASHGHATGFDEVLGNGTLVAKDFIFGTDTTPAAGIPRTPSNP